MSCMFRIYFIYSEQTVSVGIHRTEIMPKTYEPFPHLAMLQMASVYYIGPTLKHTVSLIRQFYGAVLSHKAQCMLPLARRLVA